MHAEGVFSHDELAQLVARGRVIARDGFAPAHVGIASIDITTTGEAYEITHVLQPNMKRAETVRELIPAMGVLGTLKLGDVLLPGHTYLAKASIDVNLPPGVFGYLNAKSTSGRNFLHVRTLADGVAMFDSADRRHEGYSGELWLVLQPLVYPIVFTNAECYTQLRIANADTRFTARDLTVLLEHDDIMYHAASGEAYPQSSLAQVTHDGSVWCTLAARKGVVGYRAREDAPPLDLAKRGIDPTKYFEPVQAESREGVHGVVLEAGAYYLLSTYEMLRVPEYLSAELVGLDRRVGDVFTHFAGFFDPGFHGTGTLEVYSPRTVFVRHGQPFARFLFERMRSEGGSYGERGNYQGQIGTRLPKQFAPYI